MYNVLMLINRIKIHNNIIKKILICIISLLLCVSTIALDGLTIYADEPKTADEYLEEAEERKKLPVETNEVEDWPGGPVIGAEAAILIDADTGQILYAKNIDEKLMPASTTKIMTCLTAMKNNVNLNDLVTISQSAIDANDADGSNMGLVAGEQLTVEEIMTGILVTSANEGCNALAEHMAGSMDAYVELMNEEAASLGLENTNFVTTNGLPDPNHYTTARDLATIAREFFSYDLFCRLSSTPYVEMPETELHNAHEIYSKNKLYKNRDYEYPYLVGSKTGYTDIARQTLVSCAEKDGIKLICVILMEEAPYQFEDTVNLFDYGFNNFSYVRTSDFNSGFFSASTDFLNSSSDGSGSLIKFESDSKVLLPIGCDEGNVSSKIVYGCDDSTAFATVNYYFNGYYISSSRLIFKPGNIDTPSIKLGSEKDDSIQPVMINIVNIIIKFVIVIVIVLVIIVISNVAKRVIHKQKEVRKRNQRYQSTRVLNKNADKQRKIGRKREQRNFKIQRKLEHKEVKKKRKATSYTNATRRKKDR